MEPEMFIARKAWYKDGLFLAASFNFEKYEFVC